MDEFIIISYQFDRGPIGGPAHNYTYIDQLCGRWAFYGADLIEAVVHRVWTDEVFDFFGEPYKRILGVLRTAIQTDGYVKQGEVLEDWDFHGWWNKYYRHGQWSYYYY